MRTETEQLNESELRKDLSQEQPFPLPGLRFERMELAGHGGMGAVYRAWDPQLQRWVALKVLGKRDTRARRRFLREARSQAQVHHPNVCEIFEIGEVEGQPFIAMRYIDGQPLSGHHDLGIREKVRLVREVALGIHAAHEQGLIHRDIKPGNIMIETAEDGRLQPQIVDFGLSRSLLEAPGEATDGRSEEPEALQVTVYGEVAGTPAYMSPEQALGLADRLDARSDVYSLGCTLYELLVGKPPLTAGSAMSLLLKVTSQTPAPMRDTDPSIPCDLEAIVARCLAKDPDDRYQSAQELAADLTRFLEYRPVMAHDGGLLYRCGRLVRRQPWFFAVVVLLSLIATGASVSWLYTGWQARQQAAIAQQLGQEVAQLEGYLWKVASLPLHDTFAHKQRVRSRLRELERIINDHGAAARGPGSYALGAAHLALGEPEEARQRLEAAWRSGYRTPDVARALGLALSQLYQSGLDRLEGIAETRVRQREQQRLARQLRDRASELLVFASEAPLETPDYVRAVMKRCDGDLDEALRLARQAIAANPWQYEARLLEGDVLITRAFAVDGEVVRADVQAAKQAYAEAVAVAPSDARCYQRSVAAMLRELWHANNVEHRQISERELDTVLRTARAATLADSGAAASRAMLADVLTAAAKNGRTFGSGDPVAWFAQAQTEAQAALDLDPDNPEVLTRFGNVCFWRAVDAMRWGGTSQEISISELLENAIISLSRAVALEPSYIRHNLLGVAAQRRGIWRGTQGRAEAADFEQAAASFKAAVALVPDEIYALHNLAMVLHAHAFFAARDEQQRIDLLTESCASWERVVRLHGDDPEVHYSMGMAVTDLATAWSELGRDPTGQYDRALASFNRAVELFPGFFQAQRAAGYVLVLQAEYRLDHGHDPMATLEEARELLQAASQHQGFVSPWATLGALHTVLAQYQIAIDQDPAAAFDTAARSFATSLELRPDQAEVLVQQTGTLLLRARWQIREDRSPLATIDQVHSCLEAALAINETHEDGRILEAEAALVTALWHERSGQPERAAAKLDQADSLLAELHEGGSTNHELLRVTAEAALCGARLRARAGQDCRSRLQRGIAAIETALARDPTFARGHALLGRLCLLAAEHLPQDSRSDAAQARQALTRAIETNRFLERELAADLARASRLSE